MNNYYEKGRLSISDEVYNDILRKIENHEWEEGEKIPSETQLCMFYHVSRVSVRAALQKLQAQRLIVTTQGIGSFVHHEDANTTAGKRSPTMTGEDFRQFFELRQALEFKAFESFVRNMTPEDLAQLRDLVEKMREAAKREARDDFTNYDLEFHMLVIRRAGNRFFIETANQYREEFWQYLHEMARQSYKPLLTVAEEHQEIYDLLEAKKVRGVQNYLYNNNMYYQAAYFSATK